MSDKKLKAELTKLAYNNPELREDLLPLIKEAAGNKDTFKCPECDSKVLENTGYCMKCKKKVKKADAEREAKFPKGKPADPTENMSEEDAKKWEEMNDKYKDKFRESAVLRADLIKLAYSNPELREDLLPLIKESAGNKDTFKCPECGSKVLENTGYCMKCKKKVKKANLKRESASITIKEDPSYGGAAFSIGSMNRIGEPMEDWKVFDSVGRKDHNFKANGVRELRKIVDAALSEPLTDKAWKQIEQLVTDGNKAKVNIQPRQIEVYN